MCSSRRGCTRNSANAYSLLPLLLSAKLFNRFHPLQFLLNPLDIPLSNYQFAHIWVFALLNSQQEYPPVILLTSAPCQSQKKLHGPPEKLEVDPLGLLLITQEITIPCWKSPFVWWVICPLIKPNIPMCALLPFFVSIWPAPQWISMAISLSPSPYSGN